eukprot:CAMPEP_0180686120 /NCGR_PEP_ID=MMETSP1037_2-20121125/72768_1 /TAXON_ID=632150 /ORGANISM="Azadinium spinosum, Strain 3D9" /LENGTH=92 /DNA_ID=CAMNT_0022716853 /DNA_START=327 /DNA_END=602 /DNA_ORIENTATION=-
MPEWDRLPQVHAWPKDALANGQPCFNADGLLAGLEGCSVATVRYRLDEDMPGQAVVPVEKAFQILNHELSGCVNFEKYTEEDGQRDTQNSDL